MSDAPGPEPRPNPEEPADMVPDSADPTSSPAEEAFELPSGEGAAPPEEAEEEGLPEFEPLTPEIIEEDALRNDFMLRVAVVLLAFLMACTEIGESGTLVHIRTGEYIASHGWLPPRQDVFSYTAADRPWTNLSWLFDLGIAGVYALTGGIGLSLGKGILAAAAFYLVVTTSRAGVPTWWGSVCAGLALVAVLPQFTAQPELVTLLGLALVLWLLNRWQQGGAPANLWAMIPLFLIWGNLDPRAFLGVVLLALYGLGELIGGFLGRAENLELEDSGAPLGGSPQRTLWIAIAGCAAALLVNPFGWQTLTAPWRMYGIEYPAFRAYIDGIFDMRLAVFGTWNELQYYPMTHPAFWQRLNPHSIAGLALLAAAAVTFVLNRRNVRFGHVFVLLGFAGFAVAGSHELGVAALVAAVLATLNAQEWYRENFRQTYTVELGERLFSSGGRAVTALAFFAVALMAINGRLSPPNSGRVGVGFRESLQATVSALREDLQRGLPSPDAGGPEFRPYNFLLQQGDHLIWAGHKVFVDSRVAVYGGKDSILEKHRAVNAALRLTTDERQWERNRTLWQATFDEFGVTHALPYLASSAPRHYQALADLLISSDWSLGHLGGVTAVFYRTNDPSVAAMHAGQEIDFLKEAFRQDTDPPADRADNWPRPPSWMQRYLRPPERRWSQDVQAATHYEFLRQMAFANFYFPSEMAPTFSHLAIRHTNRALAEDPNDKLAWLMLGRAYAGLREFESGFSQQLGGMPWAHRRYHQAVHAFNQALILDPDDAQALEQLRDLYLAHGKLDLALRAAERLRDVAADPDTIGIDERQMMERDKGIRENLQREIRQRESQIAEALKQQQIPDGGGDSAADRIQAAMLANQGGLTLRALRELEHLEEDAGLQDPAIQLFRVMMLLEAGRTEEAWESMLFLEGVVEQYEGFPWRQNAAQVHLATAAYDRAARLWTDQAAELENQQVDMLLNTLPLALRPAELVGQPVDWPIPQMAAVGFSLPQVGAQCGEALFNAAMSHLESGRSSQAEALLRRILEVAPETPVRPLVCFYLYQVSGELVPLEPPSELIPVSADMFAGDHDDGGDAEADDGTDDATDE